MAPLPAFLPERPHGLAVNRHHAIRYTDHRGGPGHETALELLRVEGGEDLAEMIVRRRAVEEWTEAPEQVEFRATEAGDIDEGFGSGQHREQRQQGAPPRADT